MAEENRPRWEEEQWNAKQPNPKACETCMFSHGAVPWADTPQKASCEIFEYPESKPHDVYFEGADCEYHEKYE
jgi:hypothetical protein